MTMRGTGALHMLAAALFTLVFSAACSDATLPDPQGDVAVQIGEAGPSSEYVLPPIKVVAPGGCDPYTDPNFCEGGGTCTSSVGPGGGGSVAPAPGEFSTQDGCSDGGGGGGSGTGTGGGTPAGPSLPTPTYEGPGVFAACVGTLLVVMGTTAAMEPLAHDLYNARNSYNSARRMFDAVTANNPTLEMELLYEHRVDVAKNSYDDAVYNYATAAGASVLAVIGAVVACSPGLILPTP